MERSKIKHFRTNGNGDLKSIKTQSRSVRDTVLTHTSNHKKFKCSGIQIQVYFPLKSKHIAVDCMEMLNYVGYMCLKSVKEICFIWLLKTGY